MLRLSLLVVLTLLLSACTARLKAPSQSVNLPEQLVKLQQIKHWQIRGKLAVKDPEQSLSATMRWRVNSPYFTFRLSSFLGVTLVDMENNRDGAVLNIDDEIYVDPSPTQLLHRVTGWNIPLEHLLDWVKGVPGAENNYLLDENGLMQHLAPSCLQCGDWSVEYEQYGQVNSVWLPHKITLTNVKEPKQWIKIRIDKWTLE